MDQISELLRGMRQAELHAPPEPAEPAEPIAAPPSAPEIGRYQMHSTGGTAFLIDTVTGATSTPVKATNKDKRIAYIWKPCLRAESIPHAHVLEREHQQSEGY